MACADEHLWSALRTTISRDTWGRPQNISRVQASSATGPGTAASSAPSTAPSTARPFSNTTAPATSPPARTRRRHRLRLWQPSMSTNKVARTYDSRNRLLTVDYPGGTDQDITQTWWPNGRFTPRTAAASTARTTTNRRGLLTFERSRSMAQPHEIDYAYNTRGQPSALTYPDASSSTTRPTHGANRPRSARSPATSRTGRTAPSKASTTATASCIR